MLTELFGKTIFNIDNFHRFSFFLGTDAGNLLKRFIEVIFFTIIISMILLEYKKNKKKEYKYLIVGFFSLLLRQLFMSSILFAEVFSDLSFNRFPILIMVLDNYLEIVALLSLTTAFIFPAFKHIIRKYQKVIIQELFLFTLITLSTYLFYKNGVISLTLLMTTFNLIKIIILLSVPLYLSLGRFKKVRYLRFVLLAFFVYLLIPLINIAGFILYGGIDPRILVLQHPLPFISILLLMGTVYLTLVDKAFLKSRLKRSEQEVKEQTELNKLKDLFISIVSHELRTPITSMKLYLSLFKKEKFGDLNKKQKDAIKTLSNENDRLSLIDNLLTIKKIESGNLVLEKSKFKISEIIDGLYTTIARNKGINVINKVKKGFVVYADKQKIKQVYINLMNNAIKFTKKGDTITIDAAKKRDRWFLSIKDSGVGIPHDEIPKLFDKFYQVDNTLTRKNQGVGLGLSIVKNIVELHFGKVEVKSSLGKGSEFKVWIQNQ